VETGEGDMSALRVAVVGCGYWGPKLARNLHEMDNVELHWLCDLVPENLARVATLCPEARLTTNMDDVLQSDVDAVVLATPVSSHHALAMKALRSGKHVLVEKPLATTEREATELAETADRQGLVAMVGHTFQHNPAVNAVRDLMRSGELGEVYYLDATRANLGLFQPDINVMWDLAPHDVSIFLHLLEDSPEEVSAEGAACVQRQRCIHDVVYLKLFFPGAVLANVRVSWLDPVKTRRLIVVGSKKMLVYDDIAENKVMLYDKGVERPPYSTTPEEFHLSYRHGPETPVEFEWREPLRVECEAFVNWITTGQPACSDAWMGVRVVRVLEAAQRSLMDGGGRGPVQL
jgi:predicted dehydrogenase